MTVKTPAPRPTLTYGCGGCERRWSGVSRAHCASCHRTFSSTGLFDKHRRMVRGEGQCINPADLDGLMFAEGLWRSSEEFKGADKLFGKGSNDDHQ